MDTDHDITWNAALEKLLAEEGEKALGSSWIHNRCESYYAARNQYITIPCVVLSTLSGAASVGSQTMFSDGKTSSLAIGAVSILVGILQTLGSFWGFAKLQEAHRNADIQWAKLHRFISVEMTLPRNERIQAKDMLKIVRENIERLSETSPQAPENLIKEFQDKFSSKYADVAVPDAANGLKKVVINSPDHPSSPILTLRPVGASAVVRGGLQEAETVAEGTVNTQPVGTVKEVIIPSNTSVSADENA
jgi:hypothetical protein